MNFQEIASYAAGCLRDAPPPCSCACPFGLDVRDLVAKARKGRYGSIWRAYRDAVLFPGVVSALCSAPCRKVCVRAVVPDGGGAVDLQLIEQGIVARAERRAPVKYAIPKKPERIAVVGAGLSGLACAYRLASKGYRVTLHEAAERAGGRVRGLLADEIVDADIDGLFHSIDYEPRFGDEITDIGTLKSENAAVYVATGKGGESFGLSEGWDSRTLATATPGVFGGGSLTSAAREPNVADSIENGLRASSAIEEFLKTGRNEGMGPLFNRPRVNEKFYALPYDFDAEKPEKPAGQPEPPDACVAEAFRCPGCNCFLCIDACELIRYFRQNPKRIAADLSVTVLPVDEKIKHVASRMLNSCNLCGLCVSVCPVGVDTCEAMRTSRHLLNASGHLPAAYHDFWMEDMAFSQSEEAYALVAPRGGKARALFFPGCQLTASLPQAVERTFDFIRRGEPDAAMLLSCCGVPADWAGEKAALEKTLAQIRADWERLGRPELLYACSTCKKTFERCLPEVRGTLVYEWLAARGAAAAISGNSPRGTAYVYDPCASRDDAAGQAAVRSLARAAGFDVAAADASERKDAACCGFGGHIYPANPGLLEKIIQKRTQNSELPYITYCANCRDLFLSKEKNSRHILEILFPSDAESGKRLPTLTERRENRRSLKAKYTAAAGTKNTKFDLWIPLELEEKMNRLLLLREDVAAAIAHCEAGGARLFDPASGHSIGSYRGRLVTVWVEYEITPGTNRAAVYNVYSHRMRLAEPSA